MQVNCSILYDIPGSLYSFHDVDRSSVGITGNQITVTKNQSTTVLRQFFCLSPTGRKSVANTFRWAMTSFWHHRRGLPTCPSLCQFPQLNKQLVSEIRTDIIISMAGKTRRDKRLRGKWPIKLNQFVNSKSWLSKVLPMILLATMLLSLYCISERPYEYCQYS